MSTKITEVQFNGQLEGGVHKDEFQARSDDPVGTESERLGSGDAGTDGIEKPESGTKASLYQEDGGGGISGVSYEAKVVGECAGDSASLDDEERPASRDERKDELRDRAALRDGAPAFEGGAEPKDAQGETHLEILEKRLPGPADGQGGPVRRSVKYDTLRIISS